MTRLHVSYFLEPDSKNPVVPPSVRVNVVKLPNSQVTTFWIALSAWTGFQTLLEFMWGHAHEISFTGDSVIKARIEKEGRMVHGR